jgi:two-component system, chemotaxis family, sensor kinase CheA
MQDDDLRELFQSESAEQLARLGAIALELERAPDARGLIDEAFRLAHNLKGNARLLGYAGVERVAHALEDVLGAARRGALRIAAPHVDLLCASVDALRELCVAASSDPASGESVALASRIRSVLSGSPVSGRETARPPRTEGLIPDSATGGEATVRVKTRDLDRLLESAGELLAARARLDELPGLLADLGAVSESIRRDVARLRGAQTGSSLAETLGERLDAMTEHLEKLSRDVAQEAQTISTAAESVDAAVRASRLVPLAHILEPLPRAARDVARSQGKSVVVRLVGVEPAVDRGLVEALRDPLLHLVRNAVDHGIESPSERTASGKDPEGRILVEARQTNGRLQLRVEDDGRGIDGKAVRDSAVRVGILDAESARTLDDDSALDLVFRPALTTRAAATDVSGRGVGLDVVRTAVTSLSGSVSISSTSGRGTTFEIVLPLVVATRRLVVVAVGGHSFAIPVDGVLGLELVGPESFGLVEGREIVRVRERLVPVAALSDVLRIPRAARAAGYSLASEPPSDGSASVLLLGAGASEAAVVVDRFERVAEAVIEPLGRASGYPPVVAGTAQYGSSGLVVALNPPELVRAVVHARRVVHTGTTTPVATDPVRKTVLLVDDSIISRTQQRRILEAAGFEVVTAVDGLDGLDALARGDFDCVVTDVEMPRLDGFELTRRIRAGHGNPDLPVVIVTSLNSDAERRRGVEVGADAYITKGEFDQDALVGAIRRLT